MPASTGPTGTFNFYIYAMEGANTYLIDQSSITNYLNSGAGFLKKAEITLGSKYAFRET
jgi:hypothetical protein